MAVNEIPSAKWLHGRLKGYGYRMTQGREAVLNALSASKDHLSADDIYMKIRPLYPGVGLTTIYRTLDILVNLGMVLKFDFGDGRARYELIEEEKATTHHHHIVCTKCRKITNYKNFGEKELKLFDKLEKSLSKKFNFEIKNHVVQFLGICGNCLKQD